MSLGDARSYYVTTARNDLGVIFATSEAGEYDKEDLKRTHSVSPSTMPCPMRIGTVSDVCRSGATMEPVSWQEMRCPKTGKIEKRKCAKPEGM